MNSQPISPAHRPLASRARALPLLLLFCACDGSGEGGERSAKALFTVPGATTLGGPALNVAAGDLDGNGRADLVAATSAGIEVLRSSAQGDLRLKGTYNTGGSPSDVALADFDGDGRLDLAVTDRALSELLIYLGKGQGSFEGPTRIPTGPAPEELACADLDADGDLDLVVRDAGQRVFLGDGTGGFTELTSYAFTAITSIGVADLNGNAELDLVFAGDALEIQLDVTGPNPGGVSHALIQPAADLACGDVTGDGIDDAVVLSDRIHIEEGLGDGTFAHWRELDSPGDLTGGRLVLETFDAVPHVLIGAPLGTALVRSFPGGNLWLNQSYLTGLEPGPMAVADFTGDGILDVAIGASAASQVLLLTGLDASPGHALAAPSIAALRGSHHPIGPNDGSLLAIGGETPWSGTPALLLVEPGRGVAFGHNFLSGLSCFYRSVEFDPTSFTHAGLTALDLDQNGLTDVAVLANPTGSNPAAAGDPVVVTVRSLDPFFWQFDPPTYNAVPGAPLGAATSGDLNGDGYDDVVVARPSSDDVVVLYGTGAAHLALSSAYPAVQGVADLALCHLTPDSVLDLVVTGPGGTAVLVGDTDGSFRAPNLIAPNLPGLALVRAQLNGDGRDDVFVSDPASSSLTALIADGAGGFLPAQTVASGVEAYWIAPAHVDVTGNGFEDVLVNDGRAGVLHLYSGSPSGTVASRASVPVGPHLAGVAAAGPDFLGNSGIALNHPYGIVVLEP